MARASIEVRPSLEELKRDDRLVMSMPVEVPVPETRPDPPLMAEWFAGMASVHPDSEREVELHFASPLFREGPALTKRRLSPIRYGFPPWSTMAFTSWGNHPSFS
jgi:hypothetical protein